MKVLRDVLALILVIAAIVAVSFLLGRRHERVYGARAAVTEDRGQRSEVRGQRAPREDLRTLARPEKTSPRQGAGR